MPSAFKKLMEFWQEGDGQLSNVRLAATLFVLSFIVDWQHTIWTLKEKFDPSVTVVSLIGAVLGLKVLQRIKE